MVTTYDIAKKVGVNQGTVSRVLMGKARVSKETAEKIIKACEELNYVPNLQAKGLRINKTFTIAVHIPSDKEGVYINPFVTEFINGITRQASKRNYGVIISYDDPKDTDVSLVELVKSRRADGIIITSPQRNDNRIELLKKANIPCAVGHYTGSLAENMVCVDIDNWYSGYIATKFLLSKGYSNIGLITGPVGHIVGEDFKGGFLKAVEEFGLRVEEFSQRIIQVEGTFECAKQATIELLERFDDIEAIVAFTALTTFGVLRVLEERGVSGVKVIGIATPLLRSMYPNVPYVYSPISELGMQMADALIDLIEQKESVKHTKLLRSCIIDEYGNKFPDNEGYLVG